MKYVISGTNRPGSRSLQLAKIVQELYRETGEEIGLIDLCDLDYADSTGKYGDSVPPKMKAAIELIQASEGIIVVVPEYNGSYPGVLKYFIDHWKYPDTFEFRPFCLVGLGGRFGGLRPVEHLQGVFGFRNAFIYPERVFLFDAWSNLKNGILLDGKTLDLLKLQVRGFQSFTKALVDAKLDASSRRKPI
ncbi:MAG TPA: NADPH-dependent FMN reductase [Bdellovibrionales bacterium]|jgi:NAD(P)H-dependent FMN reductase|nr:NADPH-dependent FMN reductase [Bdellovibrionales bacterium]